MFTLHFDIRFSLLICTTPNSRTASWALSKALNTATSFWRLANLKIVYVRFWSKSNSSKSKSFWRLANLKIVSKSKILFRNRIFSPEIQKNRFRLVGLWMPRIFCASILVASRPSVPFWRWRGWLPIDYLSPSYKPPLNHFWDSF